MSGDLSRRPTGSWEFFDHAADVGIRVQAETMESLFVSAGRALMEWMGSEPTSSVASRQSVQLFAEGHEELLVRWLQELLYLFHQQHAYFCDAEDMVVTPTQLNCRLVASVWDEALHGDYQEVKAVTYHQLEVRCENSTCRATIILDI